MADTPKAVILDAATGQVIERNLTEDEMAEQAAMKAESARMQSEIEAKALARTSALAKLAALGLTEEEIAAL
jgi:hypothetical protein